METFSENLYFARKEREQKLEEAVTLNNAKRLEYYCQLLVNKWFNFFPLFGHVNQKTSRR